MGINRIRLQAGSTEEMIKAQEAAAQDPALDRIRQQLFGEGYVQDIGEGQGIAQYYSGFGLPQSLQFTQPVEEVTPVANVTQPVVDTGGGGEGGGGGSDIDITTPDTGDAPINVDTPLTQMITTPTGDTMTVKEAMTTDPAYTGIDQSGLGGADGMSGGQATPGAEFADQNPYGGTGTMDDLGADSFPEYQEPTVANLRSTVPGITDYLEGIDPATGLIETIDTRAIEPPSLGFGTPPEADIYQDPIMGMANMNQADVIASDANVGFDTPEQTNAINEAFNSVKDLGVAGVDKLRESLTALGGKVKEGFDNTIEIGGKTIDLTKSLIGGAISLATGIPDVGFLLNAVQGDPIKAATKEGLEEQGYQFDDIGRLTTGPMTGYAVESAFGDGIANTTLDRIDKIENRKAPQTEASIEKVEELYDFLGDVTGVKAEEFGPQEDIGAISGDYGAALDDTSSAADISQDLASQQSTSNVGGGNVMDEFGSRGDTQATTGPTVSRSDPDFGQFGRAQSAQAGGGGNQGGGKIVCTMMNNSYGFGSFRNKIWLKHSKDLAPEYQIGYHKIFLPLVKLSKTNKVLKKTLEHIAVHRTIDIRQEARGKMHLLGRVYRKILEPICYIVGKHAKR